MKKTCEKNGFSSDFFEIGGNNGSFRAPIRDRCPEGTSKTREKNPPGSDLRSVPRVFLSDRRSVKKSLWAPIFDRCPAFFYRPMNGSVKKSLRGPRSPIGPPKNTRIGGDGGSLRAPIENRCPERSRKKKFSMRGPRSHLFYSNRPPRESYKWIRGGVPSENKGAARHANLTFVPRKLHAIFGGPNGFAGACLQEIRENRDRGPEGFLV